MKKVDNYIFKGKCLITASIAFLLIASGIKLDNVNPNKINKSTSNYKISYTMINTKDMARANISEKKEEVKTIENSNNTPKLVELSLPEVNDSMNTLGEERQIWYLPCEMGTITQGVSYFHYAVDITSPRGTAEAIYPIANGVISDIYTDYAGAKIVMINHNINGQLFTSQYVHLSSYAEDLYVGKEVTVNDYIGYMGSTGVATGVHLHIALVQCSMYDSNGVCQDLGSFFRQGHQDINVGFYGIYSVMDIPASWTSR